MPLTSTRTSLALAALILVAGCAGGRTASPPLASPSAPSGTVASAATAPAGSIVLVGRIMTLDEIAAIVSSANLAYDP